MPGLNDKLGFYVGQLTQVSKSDLSVCQNDGATVCLCKYAWFMFLGTCVVVLRSVKLITPDYNSSEKNTNGISVSCG